MTEAFRTGAGMGWHEHDDDVFLGCELFFRPGYVAQPRRRPGCPRSTRSTAKLAAGGRVADVGCGLGASSILMAEAYPDARVRGSDYHAGSIELARKRAADAGVGDRVTFEVGVGPDLHRHRLRPGRPRSTACTTWATRSAPPARSAPRSPTTAPGCWSSRAQATRGGQPQPGRPRLLRRSPPSSACPTRCPSRAATPRRAGGPGGRAADRDRRGLHPVPRVAETRSTTSTRRDPREQSCGHGSRTSSAASSATG